MISQQVITTHLIFQEGIVRGSKTRKFYVSSAHDGELLATIHFRPTWRCYVALMEKNIEWSNDCLQDLQGFIRDLQMEYKEAQHEIKKI
jgi:hypothetical protein